MLPGLSAPLLAALFDRRVEESGSSTAFLVRKGPSGEFEPVTWAALDERVGKLARWWTGEGLRRSERVGILAPSSLDWIACEWALQRCGAVTVPLFVNLRTEEAADYLRESGVGRVVLGGPALERRDDLLRRMAALGAPTPRVVAIDEMVRAAAELTASPRASEAVTVEEVAGSQSPASIACTSGTTGRPKAVVLTHDNCIALVEALASTGVIHESLRESGILLFLPFPHSFARVVLLAACMYGIPVALSEPATLREDAKRLQPGLVPSVPLVFSRMHEGTMAAIGSAPALRRKLALTALDLGRRVALHRQSGGRVPGWLRLAHRAGDRLVLSKVRAELGLSRVHALVSGSVAMPPPVLEFFWALGVELLEGYGSTETFGVLTCNRHGEARPLSVGPPLSGIELAIAPDGEIRARGRSIASIYASGAPIRDAEGWFATGDVGRIDERGAVVLTGRKQDLIKTAGGLRVVPYPIEQRLEQHPAIDFAVLVGEGRPYVSALLWPKANVIVDDSLRAEVARHVDEVSASLSPPERVKRHALVTEPLTIDAGLMTASLKVRRHAVFQRFSSLVESLYDAGEGGAITAASGGRAR